MQFKSLTKNNLKLNLSRLVENCTWTASKLFCFCSSFRLNKLYHLTDRKTNKQWLKTIKQKIKTNCIIVGCTNILYTFSLFHSFFFFLSLSLSLFSPSQSFILSLYIFSFFLLSLYSSLCFLFSSFSFKLSLFHSV